MATSAAAATKTRWAHWRAGLIAFAIFIGLVDGCPLPEGGYDQQWNAGLIDLVKPAQRVVSAPFKFVNNVLHVSQRWALMQAASSDRMRLTIEGRVGTGPWKIIFRAADKEHDEYEDMFEHARVFGVWNPAPKPGFLYGGFVKWALTYVLEHQPELTAARARYELVRLENGELFQLKADDGTLGKYTNVRTLERAQLDASRRP
ncbi:MAG TPA: hypothetical protein VGM39_23760 [Kofleriaceae bacterium]|jgi:hypothetical protein